MNTGWWEIDIHGCYSLVKIAFAPIYACKNNRQIWRHNASISFSRDVTDPLWWRHNAVRNKVIHSVPWITIFGSLVMRFANNFLSWLRHVVTQSLANRLTRDPKIVIHGNSCIILYVFHKHCFIVSTKHYSDVIMSAMMSQITGVSIVYSNVYSGADQRNHQSSESVAFVRGTHRWPVNSPHKRPVTRKMFPFYDIIMRGDGVCLPTNMINAEFLLVDEPFQ